MQADTKVTLANSPTGDILFWGLVLIGGIAVMGCMAWLIKRWALSASQPGAAEPWSLQQLRDMKARGQLTDDEFGFLKKRLIDEYKKQSKRKDGASKKITTDG